MLSITTATTARAALLSAAALSTSPASAAAAASTSIPRSLLAIRTFYTWNIPTTTPRTTLDDGSQLIHRTQPTTTTPSPSSSSSSSQQNPQPSIESLPPRLRPYRQRSTLTAEQISTLCSLRSSDPDTWTVVQLARRFDVAPAFVMRVTNAGGDKEAIRARRKVVEEQEARRFEGLSVGKKMRAVDRIRRKALW
ncbi:mitochondrial ribosomal protein subunit L20-domain-containing protein [Geranomyces variabilis]|nr:mitochondrial ribosomal protein subunit L20-domain-containing protein [Geranomyces variabilis]KAJ3134459.1 hypothetical protein HDU90_005073 [Geranomyces variabilis]